MPSAEGEHQFERTEGSLTSQNLNFEGPLSVLGRGRLTEVGFIAFALGPDSNQSNVILANVDPLLFPTWTAAVDEIQKRRVALSVLAVTELWKLTSKADDILRTRADDVRVGVAVRAARKLISDAEDEMSAKRVINSQAVRTAARRLCPIYPFCRGYRP